jgi:hypothetical protein
VTYILSNLIYKVIQLFLNSKKCVISKTINFYVFYKMSVTRLNVINSDNSTLQINNISNENIRLGQGGGITDIGSTSPLNISSTGVLTVNNVTDSSSVSTGSGVFSGGIAVAKKFYSGTDVSLATVSGITTIGSTTALTVSAAGILNVNNTTESINSSTASSVFQGGISIAKSTEAVSTTQGGAATIVGGLAVGKKVFVGGNVSFANGLNMNNTLITNVADPVSDTDATNKSYVDSVAQGLDIKQSVIAATTGPGTLASSFENGDIIDGVTLTTGDRILIKDQVSGIENGIYIVQATGSPLRSSDFAVASSQSGAFTFVQTGTINADSGWVVTNDPPNDVVGTDSINFTQFSGAGQIIAGAGLSKSVNTLSVNASLGHVTSVGTLTSLTVTPGIISGVSLNLSGLTASRPVFTDGSKTLISGTVTGTGTTVVLQDTPTLITPVLGVASGTSLNLTGTTASTSSTSGVLTLVGGIGINNITDAMSATNGGSITTAGGIAGAKSLYIGEAVNLATLSGITTIGSTTALTVSAAGLLTVNNTTASTSTVTGSAVFYGGIGVAKKAYIGTDLLLSNRVGSLGYMYNSTSAGSPINTSLKVLNKRTRVSRAAAKKSLTNTWYTRSSPLSGINHICWSPELSLFVGATDAGNSIVTSSDGITWTSRSVPVGSDPRYSVCWSSELNLFVMGGGSVTNRYIITSPNGITWTGRSTPAGFDTCYGVCFSPELSLFVATSQSSPYIIYSSNGTTWSSATVAGPCSAVCWSPELQIFVAQGSGTTYTSSDGITWNTGSALDTLIFATSLNGLCWSPELYMFIMANEGSGGAILHTSSDGLNWTTRISPGGAAFNSCIWVPELSVIAVNKSSTIYYSFNGIDWSTVSISGDRGLAWSPELSIFSAGYTSISSMDTSTPAIPSSLNTILAPSSQISINPNTGVLTINNTTASTTTTTGALVVSGGIGIAGTIYANSANFVTLTAPHSGLSGLTNDDHTQYTLLAGRSGGQTLTGGTAASNSLTLRSTSNATKGSIIIDETTVSSSTTTGALVVSGGIGVAGTVYANSANFVTLTAPHSGLSGLTNDDHTQYTLLAGRSGGQTITGGTAASNSLTLRSTTNATKGSILIDETTVTSSTTTGALRVSGGVGIAGGLYTGTAVNLASISGITTIGSTTTATISAAGLLTINNTTASTSTTSGALVVSGGAGIAGSLYIGPNNKNITPNADDITSQVSFSGAQSASNANVTGLSFSTSNTRSFNVQMSVVISATASLYAQFELKGVYNGTTWYFTSTNIGDTTNVTFSISAAGQVTYSSSTYTGFSSLTMKFRATTIAI